MNKDELNSAWRQYKATGCLEARNRLVEQYLRLVHKQAHKVWNSIYQNNSNVSLDDIFSEGVIGLMDAIRLFDPYRGYHFSTYAHRRVRGAMIDLLREVDHVPRLARKRQKEGEDIWIRELQSIEVPMIESD